MLTNNDPTIEPRVKQIISEKLRIAKEKITAQANLENDFGASSLEVIELIMEIEKAFNIVIPDEQAERISNADEIIICIRNNL